MCNLFLLLLEAVCRKTLQVGKSLKQRRVPAASGKCGAREIEHQLGYAHLMNGRGDVSTIPEAGWQNPGSDKTPSVANRKGRNSLGGTTGCEAYEIRPHENGDGVDLISDRFRYGPIWYTGPDAVRNAVAYAKYRSLSCSHQAKIRVLDDFGAVIQTH